MANSLILLVVSLWGMCEVYLLSDMLGNCNGRDCRFTIFKILSWMTFWVVTVIEVYILILVLGNANEYTVKVTERKGSAVHINDIPGAPVLTQGLVSVSFTYDYTST